MVSEVRVFHQQQAEYVRFHGPPGRVDVASYVDSEISERLAFGLTIFEDCEMSYVLPYDDALFVLEGELVFRTEDTCYRAGPGDVLWTPTGAKGVFSATGQCKVFYAVAPSNWTQIVGFDPRK